MVQTPFARMAAAGHGIYVFYSWVARAQTPQAESASIFKRLDPGLHFQHGIADGCQAVALVSLSEQFGFNYSRSIRERQEFHWFAGDLMMHALLDDQSACRHDLPDEFSQARRDPRNKCWR